MASSLEFVRYAAEQMGAAGEITYKKMFGEYGIYCNGKIVGLICENQLFIKITEAGRRLCPDYEEVPPYQGSKPYLLVEDIDDRELLAELTAETFRELPVSKPGKKKGKRAGKRQIRRQGQRKSNQFKNRRRREKRIWKRWISKNVIRHCTSPAEILNLQMYRKWYFWL